MGRLYGEEKTRGTIRDSESDARGWGEQGRCGDIECVDRERVGKERVDCVERKRCETIKDSESDARG